MIKGVIADVNKTKAVLLTENGEFITIDNDNYAIGQEIVYRKPSINRYTGLAACLAVVILLGIMGTKIYYTSSSYVDIDINPSFRLELNLFDVVIRTIPLNEDAKKVLSEEKISGDVKKCINSVIDISEKQGYINENNTDVEIVVISEKEKLVESVNVITETVKEKNLTVNVQKADYEDLKHAEELNISVGRLKIIEEYIAEYGGKLEDNTTELALATNDEIKALKGKKDNSLAEVTPTKTPEMSVSETPAPKATKEPQLAMVSPTKAPETKQVWTPSFDSIAKNTPEPMTDNVPIVAATVIPTKVPEVKVTVTPTVEPTKEPTNKPTVQPTLPPTAVPTVVPTVRPTDTPKPTDVPTVAPTIVPTEVPTATPTIEPTPTPTIEPTATPTVEPTATVTPTPTPTPTHGSFFPWWDWLF